MLSPEDVAWADSCLSKDPDMLDAGWNSLKDALFEAYDAQQDPSPHERVESLEIDNMDVIPDENTTHNSMDEVEEKAADDIPAIDNLPFLKRPVMKGIPSGEGPSTIFVSDSHNKLADSSGQAEPSSNGFSNQEDAFWLKHKMENIFLPTYDEKLKDLGLFDPEVDSLFQEPKLLQSTEDIFKIWDWDIEVPIEENDLMKQLHKAIDENPWPSFSNDSQPWRGLQDSSVDDLVSGIADLTLSPNMDQKKLT